MGYAIGQSVLWPFLPDWSQPVKETLSWLTDVLQARDGAQQARQLLSAPRRSFSFRGLVDRDLRRLADTIQFDTGVGQVLLPIHADMQVLDADLPDATTSIPCRTSGMDFADGGRAVLWRDATTWEVVSVTSVGANALGLASATASDWPAGTRLYPVRAARLAAPPKASVASDEIATIDAQLLVDEPCDWAAAWPDSATYRGMPVLEWRGDESRGGSAQYDRRGDSVDMGTGPIYYFDVPDMPFRAQSQRFVLHRRHDHSAFRSLLYQLAGRAGQIWVPSWTHDLRLTQAVGAGAESLDVAWAGITQSGGPQVNRRDIRLELFDGTVKYRRVTGSTDHGSYETLVLDSAFGVAVGPSAVRQINWLSLCANSADTVMIEHDTDADGVAVSTLHWKALKNDV